MGCKASNAADRLLGGFYIINSSSLSPKESYDEIITLSPGASPSRTS